MNTAATNTAATAAPIHAVTLTGVDEAAPAAGSLVAAGDSGLAGLLTYWRCEGDVTLAEFTERWKDANGDPALLPEPTTPATALSHAVQAMANKHKLLARPLRPPPTANGPARRRGLGWALVREIARALPPVPRLAPLEGPGEAATEAVLQPGELATPVEAHGTPPAPVEPTPDAGVTAAAEPVEVPAEVDPLVFETVLVVRVSEGQLWITRADAALEGELRELYDYHLTHLTPREMAAWLPVIVYKLDGVGVRENGGVYFLPAAGRAAWQRVVAALRAVSSHRIFGIPVMPAEETAMAFLDALEREAQTFVEKAMMDLPGLGDRGRKHRMTEAAALTAKLQRYEALFGEGRLESVRARLNGLERTETVAGLLAGTPADDGSAVAP